MAITTIKAIIDRFQVICEGGTLNLQKSLTPFTFEREPNATLEAAYYLEDGGLFDTMIGTSDVDFRRDQLTVWLASRLMFDGQTRAETLHTTMVTAEQLILADGPANSYHATVVAREGPRSEGNDVMVASLTFVVDYDFATA